MWHNIQTRNQIVKADDCKQFTLRIQPKGFGLVFWTLTLWPNRQAVLNFRNHAAHLKAMPLLKELSDEASYVHWEIDSTVLPDWRTAEEHLMSHGTVSFLNHPSVAHANGQTVPA
jgi:hypothetical protein